MLTRREHSRRELHDKLTNKGCSAALAGGVVDALAAEGLLSDARFAESLIRARRNRGYGPLRILKELHDKGAGPEIIERSLDVRSRDWLVELKRVRRKKFGERLPSNYAERARQARFLHYRGFSTEQIREALDPRALADIDV